MSNIIAAESFLPLWRENIAASLDLHQNQVQSRYIQLATCSIDGEPRVRTVVYRGFVEHGNMLAIHTDIRSEKCAQLVENSACEINWYFTESREQYRITGTVILVTQNASEYLDQRVNHWQQLSLAAKADYNKTIPGVPLPTNTEIDSDSANMTEQLLETPHQNFVLLLIQPKAVDHVMLLPTPHQRVKHECNEKGVWQSKSITP